MEDALRPLPIDKWEDLMLAFKSDWPHGISGYKFLETQRDWLRNGYKNGCEVLCPYGDVWNGFIAINNKNGCYELVVQCPKDTSKMEEALRRTKVIDWTKDFLVPSIPEKTIRCVKAFLLDVNVTVDYEIPCFRFVMDKDTPLFEVSIPPDVTFDYARKECIELIDSTWPHRFPTSYLFFNQIIDMGCGYALYKNDNIIAWLFISELGILTHLYVVEEERKKGYAKLIMKLVSNILLKDHKDILVFCLQNNTKSYNLLTNIGFKHIDSVSWINIKSIVT